MGKRLVRLKEAWVANRKAFFWLFASYIPVGMGAGYLGYWLLHTWDLGFIISGAYMVVLMVIWARMLFYVRSSD
jgi:hypothetical protein